MGTYMCTGRTLARCQSHPQSFWRRAAGRGLSSCCWRLDGEIGGWMSGWICRASRDVKMRSMWSGSSNVKPASQPVTQSASHSVTQSVSQPASQSPHRSSLRRMDIARRLDHARDPEREQGTHVKSDQQGTSDSPMST